MTRNPFKNTIAIALTVTLIVLSGCVKNIPDPIITDFSQIVVPVEFNYETGGEIELKISDSYDMAKYQVYSYEDDVEPEIIVVDEDTTLSISNSNQLITQGLIKNGEWITKIKVANHQGYVYLRRFYDGAWSGELLKINGSTLSYNYTGMGMKSGQSEDLIYTINDQKELGYFSLDDFEFQDIGKISEASRGLAFNKEKNVLYICSKRKRLFEYDLNSGSMTEIMKLSLNHYNLEYRDGLLYTIYKKNAYTIDPFTGKYVSSYKISGPKEQVHSDIAFDADGNLYSVGIDLYKGKLEQANNKMNKVKKGLPARMNSACIASDGFIYSANNKKVFKIDPSNGESEYLFDLPYDSDGFAIAVKDKEQKETDSDNDGVPNGSDEYPEDASRAYNTWYPGEKAFGSLAFEDLWPAKGDYDFNDMVVDYKFKKIKNSDNEIVALGATFKLRAIGGSSSNGFGFQMNIDPSLISKVTSDFKIKDGGLTFEANGLESKQDFAVVIVYGNGFNALKHPGSGNGVNTNVANSYVEPIDINVEIVFSKAITNAELGNAPFNPFIFRTDERGREIHLPGSPPTSLVDESYFGTLNDATDLTSQFYYKTKQGHPWAMNIPISFEYPLEKVSIIEGYTVFDDWARSGGYNHMDWYTDHSGYRLKTRLYSK